MALQKFVAALCLSLAAVAAAGECQSTLPSHTPETSPVGDDASLLQASLQQEFHESAREVRPKEYSDQSKKGYNYKTSGSGQSGVAGLQSELQTLKSQFQAFKSTVESKIAALEKGGHGTLPGNNEHCKYVITLRGTWTTAQITDGDYNRSAEVLGQLCRVAGVESHCKEPFYWAQSGTSSEYGFTELFFDNFIEFEKAKERLEIASHHKFTSGPYDASHRPTYRYLGSIMRSGAVPPIARCAGQCIGRDWYASITHTDSDFCERGAVAAAQTGLTSYTKEDESKQAGAISYKVYFGDEKKKNLQALKTLLELYNQQDPQCNYAVELNQNLACFL